MKEMTCRGYRIVQMDYTGLCHGFNMHTAFRVLDDFDDDVLPNRTQFWSPSDAIGAVMIRDFAWPAARGAKWPTTAAHEYNVMLTYRSNFSYVYTALKQIRKAISDARDFEDNPAEDITKILDMLHVTVLQARGGQD